MKRGQREEGAVTFVGDTVRKKLESFEDPITVASKVNAIAACADRSPDFIAPSAWVLDDQTIAMERMELGASLQAVFADYATSRTRTGDERSRRLFRRAGAALAEIHAQLLRVEEMLPNDEVWLHGDYGFSNLFCANDDSIIVLDPMPLPGSSEPAWIHGPPAYDLGMFVSCVVGRGNPALLVRARPRRSAELIREFLQGYGLPDECYAAALSHAEHVAKHYFQGRNTRIAKRVLGLPVWQFRFRLVKKHLEQT